MDEPHLTGGAIQRMLSDSELNEPLIQILAHRSVEPGTLDREHSTGKLRLMINDGQECHQYCIVANEDLVQDIVSGKLDKYSIIRVKRYSTSPYKENCTLLYIINADLVWPGSQVGRKLGDAPTNSNRPRLTAAPPIAQAPSTYGVAPPTAGNSSPSKQPYRPVNAPTTPSGRSFLSDSGIVEIATLSPYVGKWIIRGRVTVKQEMRTYNNARGEGKLFSFNLSDKSGEIKITCFNQEADKFFPMIKQNHVYYISRGKIANANKRFTNSEYECTLNSESLVEECNDQKALAEIPVTRYNFVTIQSIAERSVETPIDVIGVIENVGDCTTIMSRTKNKELKKRSVTIVDRSRHDIEVTIWGEASEKFSGQIGDIFATKSARIGTFGGRSLSAGDLININPEIPETRQLKHWWSSQVNNNFTHLTSSAEISTAEWREIKTISDVNLLRDAISLSSKIKGTILAVGQKPVYKCCPAPSCGKKLEELVDGGLKCGKCQQTVTSAKYRYMLSIQISDASGDTWVTVWDNHAESILKMSPDKLYQLQSGRDEDKYSKVLQQPHFKSYSFAIRSKLDNYQGDERCRHSVSSITPLDYVSYSNKLIDDIKSMSLN